jgi:hypothetical protein
LTYTLPSLYNAASFMAERFSEFDINKAAEALGAEPHATRDVAHGDGDAISVGETTLEVYRNARVARVTAPDARIELFRVPSYHVSADRVVFDQGDPDNRSRLLVRGDGQVSFHPVLRGPQSSTTAGASVDEVLSPTPAEPSTGVTGRSDAIPGVDPEKQEPEEQQLSGRLGRDPWFGTRGEEPAAGFPLAVNHEQGKTTWHRVVVVGELAEQVRAGLQAGQFKKGRLVQIDGIEVAKQEQTAKGGTKTTKEFHAKSIVPVKNPRPPRQQAS